MSHQEFQICLEACITCARECEQCATACLSEPDVQNLAACIRLDRDCADACWLAAGFMSRLSEFDTEACRLCALVCNACNSECEKHSHDHCQRCAEVCRRCAEACLRLAS
ncbi:MAG: four-helix bundle copper-binding protein [Planctomycetes bacterium]|nr:four-helix bundle copper-binding protein [Planctomycetota bacterium]